VRLLHWLARFADVSEVKVDLTGGARDLAGKIHLTVVWAEGTPASRCWGMPWPSDAVVCIVNI
jgi:hypothetical protein